jgi:hypothetical protein
MDDPTAVGAFLLELDRIEHRLKMMDEEREKLFVIRDYLRGRVAGEASTNDHRSVDPTDWRRRPKGGPTIRGLFKEFIASHQRFKSTDVIKAIKVVLPDAKVHSIRAELGKAVAWGLLQRTEEGDYIPGDRAESAAPES